MSVGNRALELFNRRSAGVCRLLGEMSRGRLPFEIRSMFCPEYGVAPEDPWHVHNYFEIRYALSGDSTWETPSGSIECGEGNLLLIPPMMFHRRRKQNDAAQLMGFRVYITEENPGMEREKMHCFSRIPFRRFRGDVSELFRLIASRRSGSDLQAAFLLGRIAAEIADLCFPEQMAAAGQGEFADEARCGSWEFRNQVYQSAIQYINDNLGRSLSVEEIADHCYVSARHLTRIFLQICGVTPGRKITRCRVDRAFILLSEPGRSIREVASVLGFADVPHFDRVFRRAAGLTPNEYRRRLASIDPESMKIQSKLLDS